jgi:YVTN family beta-propeller protein
VRLQVLAAKFLDGTSHGGFGKVLLAEPSATLIVGRDLYVSDGPQIVRINLDTKNATRIAAAGGRASLGKAMGIAIDSTQQFLYVSDHSDHSIKVLELSTGQVDAWVGGNERPGFADDVGVEARFRQPTGLVTFGNYLYVADTGNNLIRRIDVDTRAVTTVGGSPASLGVNGKSVDGRRTSLRRKSVKAKGSHHGPTCLAVDSKGKYLLVTDREGCTLRKLDLASQKLSTVCGVAGEPHAHNGANALARLMGPSGVCLSRDETHAYIADPLSHQVSDPCVNC